MIIGGLDVGTTGCKLTLYDHEGVFLHNSYKEYDVKRHSGEHEIDAEAIFEAVCDVIRDAVSYYMPDAIGVTTFGETFAVLDEDDSVLLPSMLYTDTRGAEECRELVRRLGEKRLIYISGVKPHHMYSLPKLMWIKNKLPHVFSKIKRVLLMEDYIVYKLTGNDCIDYSLAARTMAFDIRQKCWSDEIFEAAQINKSLFSNPVPAFNTAGEIKDEIKEKLGIKGNVKIVNGAHDQVAACVGAGVFKPGMAVDGTGTVECVTPVFDCIPENEKMYDEGYSVVPFVFDGTYVCYALSFTGGAVIKWFRDNFAKESSYAKLDSLIPDSPTGILVMPHFSGAANPYMDSFSKAAMIGLTLEHKSEDVYKALMEGVTYEILTNIEHLKEFGINPEMLCATGGGASSEVWMQIKADILGRPVAALESKEAGAAGTCMMTGVALRIYRDLYEAKEKFVKITKIYEPNPKNTPLYENLYNAYKNIYNSVRPIIKLTEKR